MKRWKQSRFLTVVLADDQTEVRVLLRRYLERDGRFSIAGEARDGLEALRLVSEMKPDALLLDLAMPNMDGLEVIRKLAEISPATTIVVLSSMSPFHGLADKALSLGASAVFDKYAAPKRIIKTLLTGDVTHDEAHSD